MNNTDQNKDLLGAPEAEVQPEAAQPENTAPVEAAAAENAAPAEKKPDRKLRGNGWKRGGMATLLSVVFIAIIVAVNIIVTALTQRFPSMDIDLTAQKLHSLSDQAQEIAKGITADTEIYLVGKEDAYRKDLLYANYGFQYSQVANLAERLQEANSHIKVEFVDPDTSPTLMAEYADESLTNGMVLVRTEKRHKILSVYDLFDMQQDQMTGGAQTYTKADSALAGALELVNLEKVPVLTVCTGHGELLYSENLGVFTDLMESQNFSVQEVDILTEDIPPQPPGAPQCPTLLKTR